MDALPREGIRAPIYISALCDEYATSFDGSLLNQLPQMIAAVNQSPALGEMFARFVDEQMQPLYTIYERARDRGQMRADVDVHLAPTLLAGSIFFSLLFRGVLLSPEDLRRNTDYILEGLLVDDT